MVNPLWGTLEKAQDDSSLIEDAIASAITAHEEDPTAHLGDGESLQSHKSEDVIDHPKASIVADKTGASDITFNFSFESDTGFPNSLQLITEFAGSPYLYLEYGYTPNGYVEFTQNLITDIYNENKTMILTFGARCEASDTHLTGYFGYNNLRFSVIAGVLKARFYRSTAYSEVDLSSIDITEFHFYKIIYLPTDDNAYFYVDGVLVATISRLTGTPIVSGVAPLFDFTVDGSSEFLIHFAGVSYSRGL